MRIRCSPAPLAAALAIFALTGCTAKKGEDNAAASAANASEQSIVPEIPIAAPEPPVDREQLLEDVLRAASDFATGGDSAAHQKDLEGKKFEVRIRFGCDGPQSGKLNGPFGWTFDEKTRALKVRATPLLSKKDDSVGEIAGDRYEAVEGFWIDQPWLLDAACPVQKTEQSDTAATADAAKKPSPPKQPQAPSPSSAHNVGIAQFFAPGGPRTQQRSGRPYETTKRLDEGDVPTGGFDLVLTGRFDALPDGNFIACTASQSGGRPTCVVSANFGTISIERADTHEVLAHWGTG